MQVAQDANGYLWKAGDPTEVVIQVNADQWDGYLFRLSYGGAELTGVAVCRVHDAKPLSAHLLQRVPLGALDRFARRWCGDYLREYTHLNPETSSTWLDALDVVSDENTARDNDAMLAKLCRRYVELVGEPGWRLTLADEFNYSESSIPTIIARARKRRFLTPVTQGQAGGRLTPKARRLLVTQRAPDWAALPEAERQALAVDAIAREERGRRLEEELIAEQRVSAIDEPAFRARYLAINAMMAGASTLGDLREMYPDHPALLPEIERQLHAINEEQP
ncbi:MAG: hypothetical protein ACRDK7_12355 [Solirubrobacteraceae bacterium]